MPVLAASSTPECALVVRSSGDGVADHTFRGSPQRKTEKGVVNRKSNPWLFSTAALNTLDLGEEHGSSRSRSGRRRSPHP